MANPDKKRFPFELTRRRIILSCAALIVIIAVVFLLTRPQKAPEQYPTVAAVEVTTGNADIYAEYVGRIRAQQFVEVRARVEGYLEKMQFEEGSYVKRGRCSLSSTPNNTKPKPTGPAPS